MLTEQATFEGMDAPDGARFVGRCTCGKPHSVIASAVFSRRVVACTRCGVNVKLAKVVGQHSSRACDHRCMSATGPTCVCSCGGRNHGGRYG